MKVDDPALSTAPNALTLDPVIASVPEKEVRPEFTFALTDENDTHRLYSREVPDSLNSGTEGPAPSEYRPVKVISFPPVLGALTREATAMPMVSTVSALVSVPENEVVKMTARCWTAKREARGDLTVNVVMDTQFVNIPDDPPTRAPVLGL